MNNISLFVIKLKKIYLYIIYFNYFYFLIYNKYINILFLDFLVGKFLLMIL